jgi:hypothetical protein
MEYSIEKCKKNCNRNCCTYFSRPRFIDSFFLEKEDHEYRALSILEKKKPKYYLDPPYLVDYKIDNIDVKWEILLENFKRSKILESITYEYLYCKLNYEMIDDQQNIYHFI